MCFAYWKWPFQDINEGVADPATFSDIYYIFHVYAMLILTINFDFILIIVSWLKIHNIFQ